MDGIATIIYISPSPDSPIVLTLQHQHSNGIWKGNDLSVLKI